ncbi:hypothetical protein ACQEVB_27910 [Pseudonocardia sp. CA-107938]|uniref:hypothetical protein n=1 Tax=Pseudonocardia sp. CA-107938 TaxID=3240021 RepID=UPI003D908DC3
MSANAPHVIAGPLTTTERPGYDLDHWLGDDAQPDLVRPMATLLAAFTVLVALTASLVAALTG